MGMFNSLFGNKNRVEKKMEAPLPWIALTSEDQLEEISEKSITRTQMIFKHSTTCGTSRMVLNMFGKGFNFKDNAIDLYYLDLHAHRNISDDIAQKFKIRHQSPQLLVIRNGEVVAHDSHGGIIDIDLNKYS